jgi:hypothetical protein
VSVVLAPALAQPADMVRDGGSNDALDSGLPGEGAAAHGFVAAFLPDDEEWVGVVEVLAAGDRAVQVGAAMALAHLWCGYVPWSPAPDPGAMRGPQ